MDCSKAEGMVNRFINHSLSVKELEDFLNHIETCTSCYDELETHFIVNEVTQQLNEQDDTDLDFKELLHQELARAYRQIWREKIRRALIGAGSCLLIGILLIFFIYVIIQVRH